MTLPVGRESSVPAVLVLFDSGFFFQLKKNLCKQTKILLKEMSTDCWFLP